MTDKELKNLVKFYQDLKYVSPKPNQIIHENVCFYCRHSELDVSKCYCKPNTSQVVRVFAKWKF